MIGISKWKFAAVIVGSGVTAGVLAVAGLVAYWKTEEPAPLRPVSSPQFASLSARSPLVVDVPAREYEYLGPFVFSTKTLDTNGTTVWSTQWMKYSSDVNYKFVAPDGLDPGMFSVVLSIDYKLNPLNRAEGEVKFLDLVVHKEEK